MANPPALPVLITMAGQPGQPYDMFTLGHLGSIMDSYAAAHRGLAPIVVEPDQLGSTYGNPLCVDGPLGNSATYILTDVVHWIKTHFRVLPGPRAWAVSGFSHGATCAVQFAAGHPTEFPTALAISSELGPTRGADTVQAGFGGSQERASAAQPASLFLAHAPYKDSVIVFAVGAHDSQYLPIARVLYAHAQKAGVKTTLIVSPGTTHDWYTVQYAFRVTIPSMFQRMGLR
jgi:S-formylglutathione hydrolase FrmB